MSIYTKAGDTGRSSTLNRTSLAKDSPVFALLGTLDELSAHLGVAKAQCDSGVKDIINGLQSALISLSGEVAGAKKFATDEEIKKLEESIDKIEPAIPPFEGFVISGATISGAQLDVCRTVCRRAERAAVSAQQRGGITKQLIAWLNRLSDLLFVLARLCDSSASTAKSATPAVAGDLPHKTVSESEMHGFCDIAEKLCREVRRYASENGVAVVAAVYDSGANAVCLQRSDGAYIASVDIAVNKAYTSASLKMPTKQVAQLAKPDGPLYGIQNTNGGKIVIFGGGVPLYNKDGAIVGALGVSGGTAEQDTAFADYGAAFFEKELI